MYYSYVLQSASTGNLYKGHTDNLQRRLIEHNTNSGKYYTSNKGTWKLIHSETFESRGEAMAREKFHKTGKGREYIKALLDRAIRPGG